MQRRGGLIAPSPGFGFGSGPQTAHMRDCCAHPMCAVRTDVRRLRKLGRRPG